MLACLLRRLPKASKMMFGLKIGVALRNDETSKASYRPDSTLIGLADPKGTHAKRADPKRDSRYSAVLNGTDIIFKITRPACKTPNLPFRSKRKCETYVNIARLSQIHASLSYVTNDIYNIHVCR